MSRRGSRQQVSSRRPSTRRARRLAAAAALLFVVGVLAFSFIARDSLSSWMEVQPASD